MKYECKLLVRESYHVPYIVKYRCLQDHLDSAWAVIEKYDLHGSKFPDHVCQINELTDDLEFEQVIL